MRIWRDMPTVLFTLCIVAGVAIRAGMVRGNSSIAVAEGQSTVAAETSDRAVRQWARLFPGRTITGVAAEMLNDPVDGGWWRIEGFDGAGKEIVVQYSDARTGDLLYAGCVEPPPGPSGSTPLTDSELVSAATAWLRVLPPALWRLSTPRPRRFLSFATVVWRSGTRVATVRLDERSGQLWSICAYPSAAPATAASQALRGKTAAQALGLTRT